LARRLSRQRRQHTRRHGRGHLWSLHGCLSGHFDHQRSWWPSNPIGNETQLLNQKLVLSCQGGRAASFCSPELFLFMPANSDKPSLSRRRFVSLLPGAFAGAAVLPLIPFPARKSHNCSTAADAKVCWLDVCAPFIVNDPQGVQSEILLTSDTFAGSRGYEDGADATEYEIYLYDAQGKPIGEAGLAKRLVVPAMQTTLLSVRDILGHDEKFWGGMRIRLRPKAREPMHASDLFSSAFVRWRTDSSFDNVHANPDPLQWQRSESFFYSMPFPPLNEYEALFSLFNP